MSLDKYELYGEIGGRPVRDRNDVLGKTPIKGLECIVKSCSIDPNGVCLGCQQYVCDEHKYRHPNCDEGK